MNKHELTRPSESMARSPLLLIDDDIENLRLLERMLEWAGYANVRSCTSAKQGFDALASFKPALIVLDLIMPGWDGYEFLKRLREEALPGSYTPILVFTADMSTDAKIRALELGASDFLTKPGDAIEIQLKVRNFLWTGRMHSDLANQNIILEAKVRQRTEHLTIARVEAIEVLANACEYRDDETGQHARRVGEMCAGIAHNLGLEDDFVESIRLAAPLHDLGKIAIPDTILFKPEQLSDEEFALMKRHPGIGANLLGEKVSPLLQLAKEIALYHHERWDGNGYEAGLAGEAIPLSARIVTVADAFDAMTHDRPYRQGRSQFEALEELSAMSGVQFDPAVIRAFRQHLKVPTPEVEEAA